MNEDVAERIADAVCESMGISHNMFDKGVQRKHAHAAYLASLDHLKELAHAQDNSAAEEWIDGLVLQELEKIDERL